MIRQKPITIENVEKMYKLLEELLSMFTSENPLIASIEVRSSIGYSLFSIAVNNVNRIADSELSKQPTNYQKGSI